MEELKFKVGNKVRRIKDEYNGMIVGDTAKVTRSDRNGIVLDKFQGIHDDVSFELVGISKKKTPVYSLNIIGSSNLIQAFAEEVKEIGYNIRTEFPKGRVITSYNDSSASNLFVIRQEDSGFGCISSDNYRVLHLPKDWDLAIKLAGEFKKQVPDYLEILEDFDSTRTGQILKTSDPVPKYSNWTKDWTWEYLISVYADYFKESTKEAFDKQTIKFELGQWLIQKDITGYSKLICKYKETNNNNIIVTDEYYQIKNNQIIGEGSSDNFTGLDNVRIATEEEVNKFLLEVANIKYPIGTTYQDVGMCKVIKQHFKVIDFDKIYGDSGQGCLRKNGEWSKIVKEFVYKDYNLTKLNSKTLKVGCKTFQISELEYLEKLLSKQGGKYVIDGKEWSNKDIQGLLSVYNEM